MQGKLIVGIIPSHEEEENLYNCVLEDPNTPTSSIAIMWRSPDYALNEENVTVTGVMKKGKTGYQYLEAEIVERILTADAN